MSFRSLAAPHTHRKHSDITYQTSLFFCALEIDFSRFEEYNRYI